MRPPTRMAAVAAVSHPSTVYGLRLPTLEYRNPRRHPPATARPGLSRRGCALRRRWRLGGRQDPAGPAGMHCAVASSGPFAHLTAPAVHRVASGFGTSCVMTETAAPRRERAGWDQRLQRVAVEKKATAPHAPNPLPCWFHAGAAAAAAVLSGRHITDRVRDCDR